MAENNGDKPVSDRKSPGFWFYTADYEKDMQILSLAAQGLWSRMLCWMSDNEAHRGFCELPSGEPMTFGDVANRVGKALPEVKRALVEMARVGIFTVDSRGCIFCRRMARDTHISNVRRAAAASRKDTEKRASNGEFCSPFAGGFAGANDPAKHMQKPTVTASASVSVSDTVSIHEEESQKHVAGATFALTAPEDPPSAVRPHVPAPTFEDWWKVWWNKTAKADAAKAWRQQQHHGPQFLIDQCVADRKRFEGTESWEWRLRLHPATWLRGKRWEDQLPPERAPSQGMTPYRKESYTGPKSTGERVLEKMAQRIANGERPL